MPLPRLLHPINITVQQIDRETTIYDEETREPVQKVQRNSDTVIPGQVLFGKQKDMIPSPGGVREEAEGYVLFRYADLKRLNMKLALNDRIIKIGHLDFDVYIIKLMPMGHYGDQNGPSLVRAYFASRESSRQGA